MTADRVDFFENAPCGLVTTDIDDVVSDVNSTFLRWTGYQREDVIGREFHSLLDSGSQVLYATQYQAELWTQTEIREVTFTLSRADGSPIPIMINAALVESDERPRAVRLAVFDSTARRDFEREMLAAKREAEASELNVRILQEASTLFLAAHDETELAEAVVSAARSAFLAARVAVVTYLPDGIGFQVIVGTELEGLLSAVRASRPLGARALGTDEVLHISSVGEAYERSQELGDLFRVHRTEALSAVPISDGERVLGAVICLFGRARVFDEPAIEVQKALARQAGLALARVRLQHQLAQAALHDPLTGLANRSLVEARLANAITVARDTGRPSSIIFADLDGFKAINDGLGHRSGDLVLKEIAVRMKRAVRESDLVGRFGGDEFVIVCDGAGEEAARRIARSVIDEVGQPILGLPHGVGVTASVGVAVYSPDRSTLQTPDSLVLVADTSMYESKRAGGNRMTVVLT